MSFRSDDFYGFTIKRGKPVTVKKKRRGVIDIYDPIGRLVKIFIYVPANSLSREAAYSNAENWIIENYKKYT